MFLELTDKGVKYHYTIHDPLIGEQKHETMFQYNDINLILSKTKIQLIDIQPCRKETKKIEKIILEITKINEETKQLEHVYLHKPLTRKNKTSINFVEQTLRQKGILLKSKFKAIRKNIFYDIFLHSDAFYFVRLKSNPPTYYSLPCETYFNPSLITNAKQTKWLIEMMDRAFSDDKTLQNIYNRLKGEHETP
jgi:hypothetical protein